MALIATTFVTATNSALTTGFSGFEDLIHKTDQSDNPQNLPIIYIGSTNSGKKLQAASNPGVTNLVLTLIDILPIWQASHAYTLGQCIQATATYGIAGKRFQCTVAGTSGASQPTWNTTLNAYTTDGTAQFQCVSDKHNLTEITMTLTGTGGTPGGSLSLGNTILGGISNAKTVYLAVNNVVNIVSDNTAYPEIGIQLNAVFETVV